MYTIFGKNLRSLRESKGLTALAIANVCGTSRSYITLIENGHRLPSRKLLPKIAQSLRTKAETVLNWYLEDIRMKIKKEMSF